MLNGMSNFRNPYLIIKENLPYVYIILGTAYAIELECSTVILNVKKNKNFAFYGEIVFKETIK